MKFTTPCFVRVDDVGERRKLLILLHGIGYDLYQSARSLNYPMLCCNMVDDEPGTVYGEYAEELTDICMDTAIDCGSNIELFKALAAMNDDNDYMQLFVNKRNGYRWVLCNMQRLFDAVAKECDWRKATADEIVEHFKK
jgi:hypothetical protein